MEPTALTGDMWWEDADGESDPAALREFKVFSDRLYLDIESDGFRYRGSLKRHGTTNQYSGSFVFADEANRKPQAGTVKASCTLEEQNGTYVLSGLWTQSDTGVWEWHAELGR
jgi:hypothetical protein